MHRTVLRGECNAIEEEEFLFRAEVCRIPDTGALEVCLSSFRHSSRIARVGSARYRIDDIADNADGCRREWIAERRADIRYGAHVALLDSLPTPDARTIEERISSITGEFHRRDAPGLKFSERVGEAELHEEDTVLGDVRLQRGETPSRFLRHLHVLIFSMGILPAHRIHLV